MTDAGRLLERAENLAALEEALAAVRAHRRGRRCWSEAGPESEKRCSSGRSREPRGGSHRFLWGACDALFTPRPLGPVPGHRRGDGGGLARRSSSGGAKPHEVAAALLRRAARRRADVARARGRALGGRGDARRPAPARAAGSRRVPALVVATYRDDELDRAHPLRHRARRAGDGAARRPARRSSRCRRRPSPSSPRRRRRRGRALPADGRQPVLRHRGARRRRRRHPGDRPRRGAGPRRAAQPAARTRARSGRDRAAAGRAVAAGALVAEDRRGASRSACAPGCSSRRRRRRRSGTSSPGSRSRSRSPRTAQPAAPQRRSRRSRSRRTARRPRAARPPRRGGRRRRRGAAASRRPPREQAAAVGAHREAAAQYARALRFGDRLEPAAPRRSAGALLVRVLPDRPVRRRDRSPGAGARVPSRSSATGGAEGRAARSCSRPLVPGPHGRGRRGRRATRWRVLEQLPPGPELAMAYASRAPSASRTRGSRRTRVGWGKRALALARARSGDTEVDVHGLERHRHDRDARRVGDGARSWSGACGWRERAG